MFQKRGAVELLYFLSMGAQKNEQMHKNLLLPKSPVLAKNLDRNFVGGAQIGSFRKFWKRKLKKIIGSFRFSAYQGSKRKNKMGVCSRYLSPMI